MRWQLVQVVADLNLAAALLRHFAALAVRLLAAVLLHSGHLRSCSACKHRQHHAKHEQNCRDGGEAPHDLSIFPYTLRNVCGTE